MSDCLRHVSIYVYHDCPLTPHVPSLKKCLNCHRFTTPERRAEHNATERARRESLNGKFHLLASALPNLQACKRPSKNQIIEKALEWVEHSLYREQDYIIQIKMLQQENKRMMEHIQKQEQQQQRCWSNMLPSPPQRAHSSIVAMSTTSTVTNANHVLSDAAAHAAIADATTTSSYYSQQQQPPSVLPMQMPTVPPQPEGLTNSSPILHQMPMAAASSSLLW